MAAHGAAPGAGDSGTAAISRGNACNLSHLGLAPHVLATLAREGVTDLAGWKKLGRRRFNIFGITSTTATKLDEAAKSAK